MSGVGFSARELVELLGCWVMMMWGCRCERFLREWVAYGLRGGGGYFAKGRVPCLEGHA